MIIYKITNNINGKIYIGQTVRKFKERIQEHKRKVNSLIGKSINKYGEENFLFEVIFEANTLTQLNEKEIEFIEQFNCIVPFGYNQCEGGNNTMGYNHKEETKIKMSKSKKEMYKGAENPFYGKTHTEEQKKKWSEQRRGRELNGEWKDKLSKAHFKKVLNVTTGEKFNSINEASEKCNVLATHITRVCKGKRKSCGGFVFKYI